MDTIKIELTDEKAYQLLREMEELKLIRLLNKGTGKISSLRKQIKKRMSIEQIESQIKSIREEWQRNT